MARFVWKKLKPQDMEKVLKHLDAMPEGERLLYGLTGKKRNELLSWIWASANKPHALYFTKDRIVLSRRNISGTKEKSRKEFGIGDLAGVRVMTGPLLESIKLEFRDGFTIKLRDVAKHQSDPVERLLNEGTAAFARKGLTDEQLTNAYFTYRFARVIPDLL
jgi:hypothetical protein